MARQLQIERDGGPPVLATGRHRGGTAEIAFSCAVLSKMTERIELVLVWPNVRAKRATTAWRAGQQAQNGPQAQRLMASVTCRWRSA